MKRTLIYYSRRILILPLYWISMAMPKKKTLWIFGEYSGTTYADNSKYLFEYINTNQCPIQTVWLSRKKEIIDEVRAKGFTAHHVYSIKGVFYAMRAGAAICCVALSDMWANIISHQTLLVNLWHGTPLKKVGTDVSSGIFKQKKWVLPGKQFFGKILEWTGWKAKRHSQIWFSTSPEVSERFKGAFSLTDKEVVATGYPRTDPFFKKKENNKNDSIRKIIFMPTFRQQVGSPIDFLEPFGFDFDSVDTLLQKNKIKLWIRLHRYNFPPKNVVEKIEQSSNIFIHKNSDIYAELDQFDLLITDLSSIFFDYLLLDKPIVFSAFDMETYIKRDRDLYYPYDEITPGPKGTDWPSVLKHVVELLDNPTQYAKDRDVIKKRFNTFCDGKNSERVYEQIIKQI